MALTANFSAYPFGRTGSTQLEFLIDYGQRWQWRVRLPGG